MLFSVSESVNIVYSNLVFNSSMTSLRQYAHRIFRDCCQEARQLIGNGHPDSAVFVPVTRNASVTPGIVLQVTERFEQRPLLSRHTNPAHPLTLECAPVTSSE